MHYPHPFFRCPLKGLEQGIEIFRIPVRKVEACRVGLEELLETVFLRFLDGCLTLRYEFLGRKPYALSLLTRKHFVKRWEAYVQACNMPLAIGKQGAQGSQCGDYRKDE